MTWLKGADMVARLVDAGELERVTASRSQAGDMLEAARRHLGSARAIAESDPLGAYVLTYDSARKAIAGILEAQGLRATSRGGHIVLYDAALAQFDPPMGSLIRPFNRMWARRNQVEYASSENPEVTTQEVLADLQKAAALIDMAERVLPELDAF
jgi:hypothetical protein